MARRRQGAGRFLRASRSRRPQVERASADGGDRTRADRHGRSHPRKAHSGRPSLHGPVGRYRGSGRRADPGQPGRSLLPPALPADRDRGPEQPGPLPPSRSFHLARRHRSRGAGGEEGRPDRRRLDQFHRLPVAAALRRGGRGDPVAVGGAAHPRDLHPGRHGPVPTGRAPPGRRRRGDRRRRAPPELRHRACRGRHPVPPCRRSGRLRPGRARI